MSERLCAHNETLAWDEQQAPEWELDALSLAGSNQESCVSGANRV